MSHPLLSMPERTEESDAVYAVLGRALAYATEFESNCRTLAHLFDIEKSDSEFSYEIYKLVKSGTLHAKIKLLIDVHGLPDWVEEKVHEARKARNFIAHEAAEDHKRMMSTPQLMKSFETTIMQMTGEIADGNHIVLDVTRMLKEGKRVHGSDVVAYSFAVASWISRENF
ncbi:hypothetical protein ACRN94_21130 [Shewanella baltica]|uniref:Uncharacterized protein n=1 Tax=Shewanella baltica (strain OS195) TaxID=399599 RepID=A9L238_SHEB9|nr:MULTISPECIES: hypothetical protein [Shewanella]ABX49456.1 hypothetical protein Sbal195_2288 [Shewanella baltica OS195]ADT94452.1 hypothetical protein Sbal678_2299 [Shewanella baltica OS678]AEG09438.1 hypothetical protein Sbal175_0137 [Shewanella baltica BA175]EHQ17044.1 hypothetical protein Sbal183_4182 [Shewanella baltica OS183]MCU8005708.1 hypothetical protein [Shewanella sp. SM96]